MHLREAQWLALLRLQDATHLPRMHTGFTASDRWRQEQLPIIVMDMSRMPSMHSQNVLRVIARFSATAPYGGYTQGNLYLLYAAGLVFDDEVRVYWAFERLVHRVDRYGPTTPYGARVVPDWVVDAGQPYAELDRDMWDLLIRLRWIYVLFGQTFATHAGLLAACDFALQGPSDVGMFALCAALLERGNDMDLSMCECSLERASLIIGQKVLSDEEAAFIISRAQLFLTCPGFSPISVAPRPRPKLMSTAATARWVPGSLPVPPL